jgi:cephalosporin hydroxylase
MNSNEYGEAVESHESFMLARQRNIKDMGLDDSLHDLALSLQFAATRYRFGYQQLWCGVPVIRLPDDIVLLQELVHELKPRGIVETGVARGGSLLLNASLMEISGLHPRVLGIDIQIYEHARDAVNSSRYKESVVLIEADSTSQTARSEVEAFAKEMNEAPILVILDSNHSHSHVLTELQTLTGCLPIGSVVVVADTIIAEMPPTLYENRPWNSTNNPSTAIHSFLTSNTDFALSTRWARRGLLSEMRDGILVKVS